MGRSGLATGFGVPHVIYRTESNPCRIGYAEVAFCVSDRFQRCKRLARAILAAFEAFPQPLHELESDGLITRIADHLVRRSDAKPRNFTAPQRLMDPRSLVP